MIAEFAQKLFVDDNCTHLLYIMWNCTDLTVRASIGTFTARVLNRLVELYASVKPEKRIIHGSVMNVSLIIEHIIERMFSSLKEKECLKSWLRLESYFHLLHKVSTSSLTSV